MGFREILENIGGMVDGKSLLQHSGWNASYTTGKETPGFNRGRNCPHQAPYTFAPRGLPY
ncbi:MAG: hypothetical protein XE10_1739, partial [Methanoculleus marisnigri]